MLYLLIFVLIICGIIYYDYNKVLLCRKINYSFNFKEGYYISREVYYYLLFIIFSLVSGLSYKVGSDVPIYMIEFDEINWSYFTLNSISLSQRQPLWTLLELLSKTFGNNFVLFKIFIAVFVNLCIFLFFKRNTKYIFSSLLLYYVYLYFDINFNVLRQSLSLAFFLIACDYLFKKKYNKSYLLIIISILFHNSAIVLIFVPLLALLPINKYFQLSFLILSLTCVILLLIPKEYYLYFLFLSSTDDSIKDLSTLYLTGDYGNSDFSFIKIFIQLLIFYIIAYYYHKSNASNNLLILLYIYIICYIFSYSIPIIGRFKLYFTPFYCIAVCEGLYYFIKSNKFKFVCEKRLILTIIMFLVIFQPIKYYFTYNPRLGATNIIQYYPYYSIFNPKTCPQREVLIDYK